jgi:HK97 family phage portal protein
MMTEIRRTGDGLAYVYQLPDGKQTVLRGENVFHVRGLSPDGIKGYSPIGMQRQLVGMGLATEAFGATFFRNGARPGGILEHPGILDDEAFERLRETWNETHGGLSNSHRLAILEEGMTYRQVGVPPEEAQFLESMKFNRSQIASIFRVPPHMIGDLDKATFSNIEQQSIEFKVFTMEPWLVRFQQAINVRLIGEERGRYFAEFLPDALLRGDTVSRYQAHSIGRQNGWLSANDIREIENLNPIEGGDVYLVPLNMVPAGEAGADEVTSDERRVTSGENRVLADGAEIRAEQVEAAKARHGLQVAYLPMFEDVAGRVVKREANDIGNAARRLLGKGKVEEFEGWLREFWPEHVDYVERQYRPLMTSYAAQIAELTAREVGADEAPVADEFLEAYTRAAAERHAGRREAKLRDVMREAGEEAQGEEEEDGQAAAQQAAIDELLAHWREVEPARTAREESVRGNNALALAFLGLLGVARKTWVTFGDNCPYCNSLKGRTVGIDSFYLSVGQSFLPIGADVPLIVGSNVGHAPAHEGCDCMVVAG